MILKGGKSVSKEITSHDVLMAVKELSSHVAKVENQVSNISNQLTKVENRISNVETRISNVETRLNTMEKDLKQEFNKTNGKIDVVDTQMEILSSTILKTQAEVRVLQRAK